MTNKEKYGKLAHSHYVFERKCPKCPFELCGRESADFWECSISDYADYDRWLRMETQDYGSGQSV